VPIVKWGRRKGFCNRYASVLSVEKWLDKQPLIIVGKLATLLTGAILVLMCEKMVRNELAAIIAAASPQLLFEIREMLIFGNCHPAIDFP